MKKIGRPRKHLDWKQFESLCKIQCTIEELASYFDTTPELIERNVLEHYGRAFKEIFDAKRGKGKVSLRRKMNQMALKGDRTMLIWLSKQYMGMRDKHEHSGPDGKAIPVTFEGARENLARFLNSIEERQKISTDKTIQ